MPSVRSVELPNAEIEFTLTNRREKYYNTNLYSWGLQKQVDDSWYGTVIQSIPGDSGSSLATQDTHTWSASITNDDLAKPVEPVSGKKSLLLRALGGDIYAFVIVGSYGQSEQYWMKNQPFVAYAAPFVLEGESLALVPTNTVREATRNGNSITVVVGEDDPDSAITVRKEAGIPTSSDRISARYITESVYGHPTLRNALAHFEEGIEEVTVRTAGSTGSIIPGQIFSYEDTTYRVSRGGE